MIQPLDRSDLKRKVHLGVGMATVCMGRDNGLGQSEINKRMLAIR